MVAQTFLVAATYPKPADAQAAVKDLKAAGWAEGTISVLYTDPGHTIKAGLIDGAIWGGVLFGLFGLLFPPVGLLVASGPILGVLASGIGGAAVGAATVGGLEALVVALAQLGMPKEVATRIGETVHKGDALVTVHALDAPMADKARAILQAHNPRQELAPTAGGVIAQQTGAATA